MPLCATCGSAVGDDDRFCPRCGKPRGGAGGPIDGASPPGIGLESGGVAGTSCPRCASPGEPVREALNRLRAIPEVENPTEEESEGSIAREAVIEKLSLPQEPRAFSLLGWIVLLLIPVVNVASIFFSPLERRVKTLVSMVTLVFIGFVLWYATGTFDDPFGAQDTTMMVGATAFSLYLVALFQSWLASRAEVKARGRPRFARSVERWKHLVYCEACGVVYFDDAPRESAEVGRAGDLLAEGWRRGNDRAPVSGAPPLWLWALLAGLLVGGGYLTWSVAPFGGRTPETMVLPEGAPSELWEDIDADAVGAPDPGASTPEAPLEGDTSGISAPLIRDTAVADMPLVGGTLRDG